MKGDCIREGPGTQDKLDVFLYKHTLSNCQKQTEEMTQWVSLADADNLRMFKS